MSIRRWYGRHFLRVELGMAVVLGIVFYVWVMHAGGDQIINARLNGNRPAVYQALAGIFGSLLGFAITAVAIVLGFSTSDRLKVVRESQHYPTLWRIFTASIRALSLATALSLGALIFDSDKVATPIALCLCLSATVLAVLRVARCVWVLEKIIVLVTTERTDRVGTGL